MIAVGTNLLLYAHRAARRALERAIGDGGGWGITQPSVAEFWSVVTQILGIGTACGCLYPGGHGGRSASFRAAAA
jgi:predicted nucleic acid-binding protein